MVWRRYQWPDATDRVLTVPLKGSGYSSIHGYNLMDNRSKPRTQSLCGRALVITFGNCRCRVGRVSTTPSLRPQATPRHRIRLFFHRPHHPIRTARYFALKSKFAFDDIIDSARSGYCCEGNTSAGKEAVEVSRMHSLFDRFIERGKSHIPSSPVHAGICSHCHPGTLERVHCMSK